MKLQELYSIQKLYFGHEELARTLGITSASARVAASRYVKRGLLVRIKRNMYMLHERWKNADLEEKFQIANLGQVPSYISLTTALAYYDLTTQMQRDFVESIAIKRTKEILVEQFVFNYTKISKHLYSGFQRQKDFFIARPEKALLDAIYLMSLGRYSIDVAAIETHKLNREELAAMSDTFPEKTKELLRIHGYLSSPRTV